MEVASSAYYYGDNFNLQSLFPVVSHNGLFEWFVYVVYAGDCVVHVGVGGVLTLYEL